MRKRLYLPKEVKQDIRDHLTTALAHAEEGFFSAHEDEDTVTGELGSALRSGVRRVFVAQSQTEIPGEWKWAITYYKFRGRGPRATESYLGADGVFQLDLLSGSRHEQKSALFQAKLDTESGQDLFKQAIALTTWREAAFVLVYSETGYRAVPLDDVVRARGRMARGTGSSLAGYLGTEFLECTVGDNELQYDPRGKRLIWRTMDGQVVGVPFQTKHRIGIRVEAPRWGEVRLGVDRIIAPDQIHDFRMQATDDELLSLQGVPEDQALKKAQKRLALAYHPDRMNELDELHRAILNRRMQEVNAAVGRLRGR